MAIMQNYDYIRNSEICQRLCEKTSSSKILFHNATYCCMNIGTEANSLVGRKFVGMGWTVNSPHTLKYYRGFKSYLDNQLPMMINTDYGKYVDMIEKKLNCYYKISVRRIVLAQDGKMHIIKFEKR